MHRNTVAKQNTERSDILIYRKLDYSEQQKFESHQFRKGYRGNFEGLHFVLEMCPPQKGLNPLETFNELNNLSFLFELTYTIGS
jgi:hypothetical protein